MARVEPKPRGPLCFPRSKSPVRNIPLSRLLYVREREVLYATGGFQLKELSRMRTTSIVAVFAGSLALLGFSATSTRAEEVPAEYRPAIQKGLEYLVKQQLKDG